MRLATVTRCPGCDESPSSGQVQPRRQPCPGCAAQCAAGHALYLDIDGTILDLAPSPEAVEVPVWMVPLLQRLSVKLDGAVAFVSGRTIAAIDRFFAPLHLPAVGVHGGEVRNCRRRARGSTRQLTAELQAAEPLLQQAIARFTACSWRTRQRDRAALSQRTGARPRGAQGRRAGGQRSGSGRSRADGQVCGRDPAAPPHQGLGIRQLMERAPFRGRIPIFAGDDTTDEDAFEVVNGSAASACAWATRSPLPRNFASPPRPAAQLAAGNGGTEERSSD